MAATLFAKLCIQLPIVSAETWTVSAGRTIAAAIPGTDAHPTASDMVSVSV
jgi:hypothetical protein